MAEMMSRGAKVHFTFYFLLRFFQLGAVSIGGFIYTYLIWHHKNHYCAYYSCSPEDMVNTEVPWQYILVTGVGTFCYIDIIVTTCYFLVTAQKIDYRIVLATESVLLVLYALSMGVIFGVPGSPGYCYIFDGPFSSYRPGNVAAKNCVIGQDGKVVLGFCVFFTFLLVFLSVMMLVRMRMVNIHSLPKATDGSGNNGPVLDEKTGGLDRTCLEKSLPETPESGTATGKRVEQGTCLTDGIVEIR